MSALLSQDEPTLTSVLLIQIHKGFEVPLEYPTTSSVSSTNLLQVYQE